MKSIFSVLNTIFDCFIEILAVLAGALGILMMLGISVDVLSGYVFHRPIMGVLELSEMVLLYVTFLAAAWVLREEGHVNMDFMLRLMSPRMRAWLNAATSFICAAMSFVLFWYGLKATQSLFQEGLMESGTVVINQGYLIMVIPLGSLPLFIQFLRRTYKFLSSAISAKPAA